METARGRADWLVRIVTLVMLVGLLWIANAVVRGRPPAFRFESESQAPYNPLDVNRTPLGEVCRQQTLEWSYYIVSGEANTVARFSVNLQRWNAARSQWEAIPGGLGTDDQPVVRHFLEPGRTLLTASYQVPAELPAGRYRRSVAAEVEGRESVIYGLDFLLADC